MGRRDNQQQNTVTLGRRDNQEAPQLGRRDRSTEKSIPTTAPTKRRGNFITNAPSNIGALARGEVKLRDVAREVPGTFTRGAKKTVETVAPGLTEFTKTTGGIIGEGLAFASSKDVREQFQAGNLDILPNVAKTTQKQLLKKTVGAGIEASIIRGIPGGMQKQLAARGGIGALEGIGFAISEGLAKDHTAEEIIDNAKLYGVTGSALNIIAPWLGPLLRKEIGRAPVAIKEAAKREFAVPVADEAESVISYINKDGEKVYTPISKDELAGLKDEVSAIPEAAGGESQIHLDAKKGRLDEVARKVTRDEFVEGHSQAGDLLVKPEAPVAKGVTEVAPDTLPIGGPTTGASRLERRLVAKNDDPAYKAGIDALDDPAVTGASNPEQIRRAAQAVETITPAQADAIIAGTAPTPEGVLRTAFLNALGEKAALEGNAGLVNRLARVAGQAARRAGQEIQFTKNFDPLDPVTNVADIIAVRLKAAEHRLGGTATSKGIVKTEMKKAKAATQKSQIKIAQAEELLDSILC